MYGTTGFFWPQRAVILASECVFLLFAYWFLFMDGHASFGWPEGDPGRNAVLYGCCLFTFVRMGYMMVVLLRRAIGWGEACGVMVAYACYYVGFSLLGGIQNEPLGWVDGIAALLFILGSAINSVSEILRHLWKKDERNQGKLYTGGLFRYAIHINYFGDVLWVLGLALLTGSIWALIMPLSLLLFFVFENIPKHDRYLRAKYGKDFAAYEKRTKKLIPYIY